MDNMNAESKKYIFEGSTAFGGVWSAFCALYFFEQQVYVLSGSFLVLSLAFVGWYLYVIRRAMRRMEDNE